MQTWLQDWRFFILIYIGFSGVWGILMKVATDRLGSLTATFIGVTTGWVLIVLATFTKLSWHSGRGVMIAMTGGVLGGIATLAFYKALRMAPANTVIPMGSLYLVVTVILSYFFLGESLGLRKLAGIAFGLLAIALLAK